MLVFLKFSETSRFKKLGGATLEPSESPVKAAACKRSIAGTPLKIKRRQGVRGLRRNCPETTREHWRKRKFRVPTLGFRWDALVGKGQMSTLYHREEKLSLDSYHPPGKPSEPSNGLGTPVSSGKKTKPPVNRRK